MKRNSGKATVESSFFSVPNFTQLGGMTLIFFCSPNSNLHLKL